MYAALYTLWDGIAWGTKYTAACLVRFAFPSHSEISISSYLFVSDTPIRVFDRQYCY
jgi:hypothetical protein